MSRNERGSSARSRAVRSRGPVRLSSTVRPGSVLVRRAPPPRRGLQFPRSITEVSCYRTAYSNAPGGSLICSWFVTQRIELYRGSINPWRESYAQEDVTVGSFYIPATAETHTSPTIGPRLSISFHFIRLSPVRHTCRAGSILVYRIVAPLFLIYAPTTDSQSFIRS
jgi:hypothetical protein